MKTIASKEISSTTAASTGYSGVYEGGDGKEILKVGEQRLSTEHAAQQRAYAELLSNGYEKTKLTISTPFNAKVGINSIVHITALKKGIPRHIDADRFLVKEIDIKGDTKSMIMNLKVVRYD